MKTKRRMWDLKRWRSTLALHLAGDWCHFPSLLSNIKKMTLYCNNTQSHSSIT